MKKVLIILGMVLLLGVVVLYNSSLGVEAYSVGEYGGTTYTSQSEVGSYGEFINGVEPVYNDDSVVLMQL